MTDNSILLEFDDLEFDSPPISQRRLWVMLTPADLLDAGTLIAASCPQDARKAYEHHIFNDEMVSSSSEISRNELPAIVNSRILLAPPNRGWPADRAKANKIAYEYADQAGLKIHTIIWP